MRRTLNPPIALTALLAPCSLCRKGSVNTGDGTYPHVILTAVVTQSCPIFALRQQHHDHFFCRVLVEHPSRRLCMYSPRRRVPQVNPRCWCIRCVRASTVVLVDLTPFPPQVRPAFEQLMDKNDIERARSAFDVTSGGTGILAAVSAAVALDPPTLVFPVADFVTLQSSGWSGDGAPAAQLRTCRVLRANSTARDVFAIETEDGVLSGELVGAEALAASADLTQAQEGLPLGLSAPIGKGAWVIRLETNRRAAQMWKAKTAVAPGGKVGKPLASVQFGDLRSKERRRGKS